MPYPRSRAAALVSVSLVLAMALRILPLPEPWFLLNPDWIALVLIYWTLAVPERVGVGTAWLTGLFTDVLTGRLLGQHALAYSVVAYLGLRWYRRLRLYPLPQQCLWILLLLLTSQLLVLWTQNVNDAVTPRGAYWLPSFSGALLWPLVLMVLRRLRRAYHIS
jgi:rod shape-determining protein MreD